MCVCREVHMALCRDGDLRNVTRYVPFFKETDTLQSWKRNLKSSFQSRFSTIYILVSGL